MADLIPPAPVAPQMMQSFQVAWVTGSYDGENSTQLKMTHNPNGVKRNVIYSEQELERFSNEIGALRDKFKKQNSGGTEAEQNEYVRKEFRLAHQNDEHWRDKGIDPLSLDHYYKNSYSNEKKAYAATHPNWNDNKNTYAQLGEAQPNTSAPASAIESGKAGALTRSAKISGDDYQFELSKDQKQLVGVRVMGLEGGNEQGNFVRFDEPFDPNNDEAIRNTLATARMQARQDISMAARQAPLIAARAAEKEKQQASAVNTAEPAAVPAAQNMAESTASTVTQPDNAAAPATAPAPAAPRVAKNLSAVSDLAANANLLANSTSLQPWELKNVEARMQAAAKQVNAGMEAVAGGANNSADAVYKPSAVRNTTEFLTTLDKSSKLAKEKGITLGIGDKELTGFLGELDKRAQQMENSLAKLQNKAERENAAGKLSDFRKAAKNLAETRGIDTKGMRFAQAAPDKQSNDDRVAQQASSEAGKPLEQGPVSIAKEEKPDGVTVNPGPGEQPGKKTALDENGKTELLTKTTTRPRREPQDGGVKARDEEGVDPQSREYARGRNNAEQGMAANDNGMGTMESQTYAMSNASQDTQKSSTAMRNSSMGVSKSQSASL